jgi:Rrf2 family transcriptional regulator, nitric oxide-sensitive transcriptional repressor
MEDRNNFVGCFDPAATISVVTPVCGLRHTLAGALEVFARYLVRDTIADLIPNAGSFARHLEMPKTGVLR